MTEIKNTTKQAQGFIRSWKYHKNHNNGSSLFNIYSHFSKRKEEAFIRCRRLMNEHNGSEGCFCGHNCDFFTFAFSFVEKGKKYLAYITPKNDYKIELN